MLYLGQTGLGGHLGHLRDEPIHKGGILDRVNHITMFLKLSHLKQTLGSLRHYWYISIFNIYKVHLSKQLQDGDTVSTVSLYMYRSAAIQG